MVVPLSFLWIPFHKFCYSESTEGDQVSLQTKDKFHLKYSGWMKKVELVHKIKGWLFYKMIIQIVRSPWSNFITWFMEIQSLFNFLGTHLLHKTGPHFTMSEPMAMLFLTVRFPSFWPCSRHLSTCVVDLNTGINLLNLKSGASVL